MKTAIALLVSLLLLTCFSTAEEVKVEKQIKYACILFDQKGQVAFEGAINPERFHKWFKEGVECSGERLEPPKGATIFGTLVLTDGEEITAMPLYEWKEGKGEHYCCLSYKLGEPPKFWVWEDTRQVFLEEMKKQLSGRFRGE